MTIHLCVPWRTDRGQRERVWEWCARRWASMLRVPIYLGTDHSQPMNRSAARNNAVGELSRHVPGWDVVVLADADVAVADVGQVLAAVESSRESGRLTYAHTWQATLTREATEGVLAGEDPTVLPRDEAEWEQDTLSGVYAVPRRLWDALGGFDERHVGFGFEDVSFATAARTMAGRLMRTQGTVFHLFHDRRREEREGQPHYAANMALYERYRAAAKSTTEMRKVLGR